jgi:pimeloyl-ACP methyl ester carboxylesterase
MRGRAARAILITLAALLVLPAAAAFGYRAWRQHENAEALRIRTAKGVEEALYVPLGGIAQWIQIRGDDRSNPVLLFIHGGPGSSESPLSSLFRPWERYFTVVMWDQRCAGKTFVRNGPGSCSAMTIDGVAKDGIALAEYLRRHLGHRKIVVLGHSWGSIVGIRMIHDRPDLFSAYVGTGQVVSVPEKEPLIYARTLARLEAAHAEDAIRKLQTVHPPYRSLQEIEVERDLSDRYDIPSERDLRTNLTTTVLFAPGWSAWDLYEFLRAPDYAGAASIAEVNRYDARTLGRDFTVPIFIFNGAEDNITPVDAARRYFDWVHAPYKAFVSVPNAGHSAVLTQPDAFLRELVAQVRPVAIRVERSKD